MQGSRILVVDDDADVRGLVRALLERAGARVREASSGREALRELFGTPPEAVVLDVSMPELDGWATLARIREVSEVPVLMLTAHGGELEKVRGLQAGADDYVTKPFGRQELIARIGALLRRAGSAPGGAAAAPEVYEDDLLHVDLENAVVRAGGQEVHLTPLELRLLATFARNPGQVLSRDVLLDRVWGNAHVGVEQVKLNVGTLRRKLQAAIGDAEPAPIETVRGFGWRLTRRRP